MSSTPFIILGAAVAYTTIRAIWATYIASRWEAVCERYMERRLNDLIAPDATPSGALVELNGPRHAEVKTLVEYSINASTIWPMHMILTYFWVWDFKRFIVHQDEMDAILAYFRAVAVAQAETVE